MAFGRHSGRTPTGDLIFVDQTEIENWTIKIEPSGVFLTHPFILKAINMNNVDWTINAAINVIPTSGSLGKHGIDVNGAYHGEWEGD